jgi:membrane protein DedA with SNARE-associated domain
MGVGPPCKAVAGRGRNATNKLYQKMIKTVEWLKHSLIIRKGELIYLDEKMSKYWHYYLVVSVLTLSMSITLLMNGFLHFLNLSSGYTDEKAIFRPFSVFGYGGIALAVMFFPLPDYIIVPFFAYLSSVGEFNVWDIYGVSVLSMVFLMSAIYAAGRLATRPIVLKILSYFRLKEEDIEAADKWVMKHGTFSIFIATFIPYFKTVTSLAAGTLKMNYLSFLISNIAGFGIRFLFLVYIGYYSIFVLTPQLDYSLRWLFLLLILVSAGYIGSYLFLPGKGKRMVLQALQVLKRFY